MNESGAGGGIAIFILILIICYFIPTVIALLRSHKDSPAIVALNILLGWSVVGWIVSFIWALSDPRGRNAAQTVVVNTAMMAAPTPPAAALAPSAGLRPAVTHLSASDDRDIAYWDSIDKSDPDLLEEYLVRFPDGRFAQLARKRLERANGGAPASMNGTGGGASTPASEPSGEVLADEPVNPACGQCGAVLEREARFCGDCGAAATAV